MTQINSYVTFQGNCLEAMNFYKECIGGELDLQTVAGTPLEAECPPAMRNQILHAVLSKDALMLMGSDMIGPGGYVRGTDMALSLNCSSEAEINSFFNKLSAGGKILHELHSAFWGATFGALNDRFGIRWMLTYDKKLQA
jgi:PhnB protein